eukprot:4992297-Prymnesium_polylepis.1
MLCSRRPGLRFMDVQQLGGFQESARVNLPEPPTGGRLEYSIGYRHMVSSHCRGTGRHCHVTQRATSPQHHCAPHDELVVPRPRSLTLPQTRVWQCHFMSMLWFGALHEYEYAMR